MLKWAGGKRKQIGVFDRCLPPAREVPAFRQPCFGGGSPFWQKYARVRPAILSDTNRELIAFYVALRDRPEALLAAIAAHDRAFRRALAEDKDRTAYKALYYRLRAQHPDALPAIDAAARFYVLNKLGNNGMYRVNANGGFNVPVGKTAPRRDGTVRMPTLVRGDLFRAASRALQGTTIVVCDVVAAIDAARPGELVYIDSPYWPDRKGGFTGYTAGGFGEEDQRRLAAAVKRAAARDVLVAASNHDVPDVRRLYAGMHFERVMAARSISSKATTRGPVAELLILTFPPRDRQSAISTIQA